LTIVAPEPDNGISEIIEVNMLAYLFLIIALAIRLLPHSWHLTPLGAALLFFGATRPRKEWVAALAMLAACDVYLTRVHYGMSLSLDHVVTWAWYVAAMGIGYMLVRKADPLRVVGASLASAISFFVVSNFATWLFQDLYAKTFAGLLQCYTMAIPFFRGTLASDLIFTPVLFSVPYVLRLMEQRTAAARVQ
jgi:hypothetical protein